MLVILMMMTCACAAAVVLWLMYTNEDDPIGKGGGKGKKGKGKGKGKDKDRIGDDGGRGSGSVGQGWNGGRLLATYLASPWRVVHAVGTGAGKRHAGSKDFEGGVFPIRTGAVVSFEVKFDNGFEWGCGGKLGGLQVGPGKASGGDYSPNGASHRVMWDDDGGVFSYVYIPQGSASRQPSQLADPGEHGQNVFKSEFARTFRYDTWHTVHVGVRLNAVGRSDGKLLFGVDNKIRVLDGVMWRLSEQYILRFGFGIFHGGPCDAERQSASNYRNVRVYEWNG